jgi:hypothetical protein
LNTIDEIQFGVARFYDCMCKAIKTIKEELDYYEDYEGAIKQLAIERVEDFIEQVYPKDGGAMQVFQRKIDNLGARQTDENSAALAKLIYEYLQQGITLASLGKGQLAQPDELLRYTTVRASEFLINQAEREKAIPPQSAARSHTDELAWIIGAAGVLFFSEKHNVGAKAIQAAFISGVGVFRLWLHDDFFETLCEMKG